MITKIVRLVFLLVFTPFLLIGCASKGSETEEFIPPAFPPPPEKARFIYERTFTSSFDVKEITAADRFKMFATGSAGTGYGLAKPYGVAVYQGRVYVTDTVQRMVFLFDVPGRDFKTIGQEGLGQLLKPIGLVVDRNDGTLYVVDNSAKRVVTFDKDGKFLRAIGGGDLLVRPSGITLSPDGNTLYVIDTGGVDSREHRIQVFDAHSGDLLESVGERGTEQAQFNLPLMAATAPDGTLYVVDGGNFRVQAFNPDGSFKMTFGAIGRRSGQFSRPKGIATDKDGNVYVVDAAFGNFQIFSPQGELLLFVGDRGYEGRPAQYMLPAGIDVDEDGRVYMVDQYFRKVDVFRPADLPETAGWLSSVRTEPKK